MYVYTYVFNRYSAGTARTLIKQSINKIHQTYIIRYYINLAKKMVDSLSDAELRTKLVEYGYPVFPVTHTTRKILKQKLNKLSVTREPGRCVNTSMNQHNLKPILMFFDIETSGLEHNCEILQIAIKHASSNFNEYITPTKSIPWNVSEINKLSNRGGELYYKEDKVASLPVRMVLENLLRYLKNFQNKCVLVAHNGQRFDVPRLIRIIRKEGMEDEFSTVIEGFTDTLIMFRNKYPDRRGTGSMTMKALAQDSFNVNTDGIHNALCDVFILEKLSFCHFSTEELLNNCQSFAEALEYQKQLMR